MSNIGASAFLECYNLKDVYVTDMKAWFNIDFEEDSSNPMSYAENLYLNNDLVEKIVIPDTLTEIKQYTFVNFDCITSITIPD